MSQHFVGQHINEEVLVTTRPHWIVFLSVVITGVMLLAVIPIALALVEFFAPRLFAYPYAPLLWLGMGLYGYAVWSFFFLSWLRYWLDVWIITTERIIKIEQHHLFSREMAEFRISRIQDVTVEINGFLATMLKFGDLKVFTASEESGFTFKRIPHPEKIKDIILHHQAAPAPLP
ncbi:MAG: PH domain-containing protein [bacterium]|nr:PH domain-containing protein [bacterium]